MRHTAGPIFAAGPHHDSTSALALLLSLTHDFPVEWTVFVNGKDDPAIPIVPNLFPYLAQGRRAAIDGLVAFAPGRRKSLPAYVRCSRRAFGWDRQRLADFDAAPGREGADALGERSGVSDRSVSPERSDPGGRSGRAISVTSRRRLTGNAPDIGDLHLLSRRLVGRHVGRRVNLSGITNRASHPSPRMPALPLLQRAAQDLLRSDPTNPSPAPESRMQQWPLPREHHLRRQRLHQPRP